MKLLEHGPKEILYTLKRQNPEIIYMYDLENSKFNEIDPATAANIIKTKSEPENILLFVDGKLVRFDSDGKVASMVYVSDNKKYVTKSGKVVTSTNKMPVSHLLKIADKIYYADFAKKRMASDARARKNSVYASTTDWPGSNSRGLKTQYGSDVLYDFQGYPSKTVYRTSVAKAVQNFYYKQEQFYAQKVEQAKQDVEEYENLLKANPEKQSDIQWKLDSAKYGLQSFSKELDKIRQAIKTTTNAGNDIKAAYRYSASAADLQDKLAAKVKKLKEVQRLRNKIQHAADVVDKVQKEGSDKTISRRNDLEDAKRKLAYFGDKLDSIKATLDNAHADDKKAIKDAMAEYDEIERRAKKVQDLVGKLARIRNKR